MRGVFGSRIGTSAFSGIGSIFRNWPHSWIRFQMSIFLPKLTGFRQKSGSLLGQNIFFFQDWAKLKISKSFNSPSPEVPSAEGKGDGTESILPKGCFSCDMFNFFNWLKYLYLKHWTILFNSTINVHHGLKLFIGRKPEIIVVLLYFHWILTFSQNANLCLPSKS